MANIKNPWAKQTTGAITIQLSRSADFGASDNTRKHIIAQTTTLTLDATKFAVNTVSGLAVATTVQVVQEPMGTMKLSFTLASQVPGKR